MKPETDREWFSRTFNEIDGLTGEPAARWTIRYRARRGAKLQRHAVVTRRASADETWQAIQVEVSSLDGPSSVEVAAWHSTGRSPISRRSLVETLPGSLDVDDDDDDASDDSMSTFRRGEARYVEAMATHHQSGVAWVLQQHRELVTVYREEAKLWRGEALALLRAGSHPVGASQVVTEAPTPEMQAATDTLHHAMRAGVSTLLAAVTGPDVGAARVVEALREWFRSLSTEQVSAMLDVMSREQALAFSMIVDVVTRGDADRVEPTVEVVEDAPADAVDVEA
jgi:hypothetical protein